MKKLAVVLIAIISMGLLIFSGCNNGGTFTENTYSSGETVINSVILDVSDREVDVAISSDNQIHINYFESEKEYYTISETDGTLKMTLVFDKEWTDFIGTKADKEYRKINLEIPDALMTNLSVTTTNERIKVTELKVNESISLNSNGGGVEFEKLSAGKTITISAKDADIIGSVIGGWDEFTIKVTIKKGESNLVEKDGGEKLLTVNCNNGNINIDLIK